MWDQLTRSSSKKRQAYTVRTRTPTPELQSVSCLTPPSSLGLRNIEYSKTSRTAGHVWSGTYSTRTRVFKAFDSSGFRQWIRTPGLRPPKNTTSTLFSMIYLYRFSDSSTVITTKIKEMYCLKQYRVGTL